MSPKVAIYEVTQLRGSMQFLAEQHLVAAKLLRESGARRTGAERELFIKKSNSFVMCARLCANKPRRHRFERFQLVIAYPGLERNRGTSPAACTTGY